MKIVLATAGSRGDVQPMLALALALQAEGHDVQLAGPPERIRWASRLGCPYVALGNDTTAFIDNHRSVHSRTAAAAFVRYVRQEVREQFKALPGIVSGADLVIGASLCFGLSSIAEAMGIAYRYIAFTPQLLPSGHYPCPVFKHQGMPAWWNRIGWRVAMTADRFNITRLINYYRRELGLVPVRYNHLCYLGKNPVVASDPVLGRIPPDTPMTAVQTGYMHLKQPVRPLPELERFLAEGPPPVYVGFGSMPRADQADLTDLLLKAACRAGRRIVVARPWEVRSGRGASGDLFFIQGHPHAALFPRMAAIVHHGGAGTTATAAAGGVPQVIVPHVLDQYYWGDRVHKAGIGAKPIWRSRLTSERLGRAIREAIHDSGIRQNARTIQKAIHKGNGLEMTVEELTR